MNALVSFFITENQTYQFDYFSLILLAIFILNFVIYLRRGFTYKLISLGASIGSLVIAFFTCVVLGNFIYNAFYIGDTTANYLYLLTSQTGVTTTLFESNIDIALESYFGVSSLPDIIIVPIRYLILFYKVIPEEGVDVSMALAMTMSHGIYTVVAFFLIWLVAYVILKIAADRLEHFRKDHSENTFVIIDTILGGISGLFVSAIIVLSIDFLLVLFSTIPLLPASTYCANIIATFDDSKWTVTKAIFNLILSIFNF